MLALSAVLWKRRRRAGEVGICALLLIGVGLCVGPTALSGELFVALLPAFAAPIGWVSTSSC